MALYLNWIGMIRLMEVEYIVIIFKKKNWREKK